MIFNKTKRIKQLEAENKILKEFILVYNEVIETLTRLRIIDSVLQEQTKKHQLTQINLN